MKLKSWKESFVDYWSSRKGKSLMMSVNMAYVLITMILCLALQLCAILQVASISQRDVRILFTIHFIASSLSLGTILILGMCKKLTNLDNFKDQTATAFLRAGMIGLGTGGMVYYVVGIVQWTEVEEECQFYLEIAWNSMGILFIFLQIAVLVKYSRLIVNKSVLVSHLVRFLMAQVLATNAGLWITLIGMEAEYESSHLEEHTTHSIQYFNETSNTTDNTGPVRCMDRLPMLNLVLPYTFPMLIEYCVVSSTMAMVIWENCGLGVSNEKQKEEVQDSETVSGLNSNLDSGDASLSDTMSEANSPSIYEFHRTQGHSKYAGTVLGWFVLCITLALTVTTTYYLYSEDTEFNNAVPYSLNITLTGLWILAAGHTFWGLSKLTFYDEELRESAANQKGVAYLKSEYTCEVKHKMDQRLSTVTLLSLVALKLFSAIAALDVNDNIILADAVLSVIFAVTQNLFLAYAENKRVKTHDQLKEKPGLAGLEFIRIVNFALWINNTFLLKNPASKEPMNESFGIMEWAVVSNIFQPLAILYYFHAMVTVAEVIYHVYTSKFVGVIRRSKKKNPTQGRLLSDSENMAFDITEM